MTETMLPSQPPDEGSMATVPIELLEARVNEYRLEIAKRDMQLILYRETLEKNGIEPPDKDGAELLEMWRDCRLLFTSASQFVMKLGTGKELLVDWSRDAAR